MAARVKQRYLIAYIGYTGKREEITVEADSLCLIDGIEDSLMSWRLRNKVVFAMPFHRLIHTLLLPATKLEPV